MTKGFCTPKDIASRRKTTTQAVYKALKKLEAKGIVKRVDVGIWELSQYTIQPPVTTGSMRGLKNQESQTLKEGQANLHALEMDIPILKGDLDLVKDFKGYVTKAMRGWVPQYKRFMGPLGFTVRNNNNKSISLFLFSREIPRNFDVTNLCLRTVFKAYKLMEEKGVILDYMSASVKNLNISVRNQDLDKVFNKGEKFEVLLGRQTKKIFEKDKEREAAAWVDSSPYLGVETNDLRYKENLIMVPERVERMDGLLTTINAKLTPAIENLAEEMNTHVDVMQAIREGISAFNKTVKGFKPKQTLLGAWPKKKKRKQRLRAFSKDDRIIRATARENVALGGIK